VQGRELTGHTSTGAFAKCVDPAGINGISFLRPCDQFRDRLDVCRPEAPTGSLGFNRQKNVAIAQSQPLERHTNRVDIGGRRLRVFLEAHDHAQLPGGIGSVRGSDVARSLYKIVDNDLTGFILEVALPQRSKRRRIADSYDQSRGETAE